MQLLGVATWTRTAAGLHVSLDWPTARHSFRMVALLVNTRVVLHVFRVLPDGLAQAQRQ
jgi:hypothetical protein